MSANPGQPLKSLAKVASGGELSRISLAVQVAAAADTAAALHGVRRGGCGNRRRGGGNRRPASCARSASARQVLCVTHLAQVAAQAHAQFRVTKLTDGKITRTAVKPLGAEERVDEIARMSGGIDITDQARAHAREMLAAAGAAAKRGRQRRSARRRLRAR